MAIAIRTFPYFRLGLRAYRDVFRFTGRSRPLEVLDFCILAMLLTLIPRFVESLGFTIDVGGPADNHLATRIALAAIETLLTLPLFALTARRLQDFDLPGWPLPPLMAYVLFVNQWKSFSVVTDLAPPSTMYQVLAVPIVVAMLIAWFIPGTPGPNRYGPDPRA